MRLLCLALISTGSAYACLCVNMATPCSEMDGSKVVFVGRVLVQGGWLGSGPALLTVEEPIHNVPLGRSELEIDTGGPTGCDSCLTVGKRYVVFATAIEGPQARLFTGGCSKTFAVQGNEHVLDALRNAARGGAPRLVGRVREDRTRYSEPGEIAGAKVTAESGALRHEVLTDSFGRYEFLGLTPGRYRLDVSKSGMVPNVDAGTVLVRERSCEVRDLRMVPNGRISGIVGGPGGQTLGDVSVQAFGVSDMGKRNSTPFLTVQSRRDGSYTLGPLPGGDYAIGVNANEYQDEDPYPRTFHTAGNRFGNPAVVRIADGEEVAGIDLVLPRERIGTTLRVTVIDLDSRPLARAGVALENLASGQYWRSDQETDADGLLEVPVYFGGDYNVRVSHRSDTINSRGFDYLEGMLRVHIGAENPSVIVILAGRLFRAKK